MHQEVLGFGEFHQRVPVFPEVLLVLPGLHNWAHVAHFGLVSEVLLNLGPDLPVPEGTLSVLGFADLSRNTAPKEAVGLAENLVFSRFVLVSNKAEGLRLCPARHKPEPTHLPPNPWKYSRRASLEASSGKSLKASTRVFTFFPGSAIWMHERVY